VIFGERKLLETPAGYGTYATSKAQLTCQLQHYVIRPPPLPREFLSHRTKLFRGTSVKTNLRSTCIEQKGTNEIEGMKDKKM
jgi:hypothetical protein